MAFSGLDEFVRILEHNGQLVRIKEFVDPKLEISEIADRISKQPGGGKALLFENTGTSFPLLINAFGSYSRVSMALGMDNLNSAGEEIDSLFKTLAAPKNSLLDKIKMLPLLSKVSKWMPVSVSGRGACQQVVHLKPNLGILPVLTSWPHDGGPFITLPMVNSKDPETGIRNVGMYRMQVFSESMTGMHWHKHKTGARHLEQYRKIGERMPIAVALGGDPTYTYAATAPLPDGIDEYLLAGFLRKKPVKLVKALTADVEIPYDADIVIEGYVDPQEELIWEGPFGDHTGFYSLADWYPKFFVTCITHKQNAIFPATIVGVPPMEDKYLAEATERIFLNPIKFSMAPEVIDMHLPDAGVAHNLSVVKIKKTYPGQAYKVANALWGAGQMMFNKVMIVVDSAVDIRNPSALALVITENFDPESGFFIGKGPLDVLDHSSSNHCFGGKLLIDVTTAVDQEVQRVEQRREVDTNLLSESISTLGLPITNVYTGLLAKGISILIFSVDKGKGLSVRAMAMKLATALPISLPKIVIFIDKEIGAEDMQIVTWYVLGNVDPERDCYLLRQEGIGSTTLAVDGTRKTFSSDNFKRSWPNIVLSSKDTIARVDAMWDSLGLGPFISSPSNKFGNLRLGESATVKNL